MKTFFARIHEICRGQKHPDMVDLYVKTKEGKKILWATVPMNVLMSFSPAISIDFLSDADFTSTGNEAPIYTKIKLGDEIELAMLPADDPRLKLSLIAL